MQLDRTRIVIRQRSIPELLDLSLRVVALNFRPLLLLTGIVALPLAIMNEWMLGRIVADEMSEFTTPTYLFLMAVLVLVQAPFATAGATLFLGRMMFLQATETRIILKQLRELAFRIVWTQVLKRGILFICFLAYWTAIDLEFMPMLILLLILFMFLRMLRPFINEIVLLERNPLRSRDRETITVGKRSASFHGPSSGELVGRFLLCSFAVAAVTVSLICTLWFCQGALSHHWSWNGILLRVLIPTSFWLAAVYGCVVRFLSYLDLRIRREGWEVQLKVQAAAVELQEQFA